MIRKIQLPKFTPPSLAGVYPRPRLFDALDNARKKPVVWISAPGGSGKATLVASYLEACSLNYCWYQFDEADVEPGSLLLLPKIANRAKKPMAGRSRVPIN